MTLPVAHSILAPGALSAEIARSFAIGRPINCALYRSWTNDVYRVTTTEGEYYLKVYGYGWRTREAVSYEVDLYTHLATKGIPIAPPIPQRAGEWIGTLHAPEGERCCVLFAAAPGEKPQPPFSTNLYHQFGRATAQLHTASDDFSSRHARDPLDLDMFIDRPLRTVLPLLDHRPDDRAFLLNLSVRVREYLTQLIAAGLDWGVCHGDLSLDNVHITPDGRLVFYDFDSGGPGWRASDPYGVFEYAMLERNGFWDAFLTGYTEIRHFSAADLAAIPYFVAAQHLWDMAHEVRYTATRSGLWRIGDAYFDRNLAFLRRWGAEFLR
jgi:Ser/Thr protein kinase RdoA (MazF antagonist)